MQLTNIHNRLIWQKASEMGIDCYPLVPGLEDILVLDNGQKQIYINKTRSNKLAFMAGFLSKNKIATNLLLQQAGLPIPPFCWVEEITAEAEAFLETHAPVVVKPYDTNRGVGVVMNVRSITDLRHAIRHGLTCSNRLLVQKQAEGNDYRVLVIGGKVVGVLENRPPAIVGDGASTIRELIQATNQDPRRGSHKDADTPMLQIPLDEPLSLYLESIGLHLDTILPAGQFLHVRLNGNDLTGGVNIDRTDEICKENEKIALAAAAALGVDVAGIDLRCPHIGQPITKTGGGIIEVNALPGMDNHMDPAIGQPRDVIGEYLRYLFE